MLEVEDGRARLRNSFARLTLAAYFCEVAGSLAREDHAEPRLYGLLETALLVLDAVDTDPASALRAGFEAKALTFAGIAPVLDRCVACSRAPDADLWFSPAGGGVFHVGCLPAGDASAVAVSPAFAQALEAARRAPLASLVDTALPPGPIDALSDCVAVHLGRPLQSRALLDALG
jgi:recombinational DNA repair protein (RecF pathway)